MRAVKIYKAWYQTMYPSELMVLVFLNFYKEKNGMSFYGNRQQVWEEMNKIVSLGTVSAGISRAKGDGFLETVGKTRGNKNYKVITPVKDDFISIPDFLLFSNKFSPLQKLFYGYICAGFTPNMTKDHIFKELNILGHRYFQKDLKFLVEKGLISIVDRKYYRSNPIAEKDFEKIKDWHTRFKKKKFSFRKFLKTLWKKIWK